jgi:hypothetical protein
MQARVQIDWSALEREALRLHARYAAEVVEELGLCPWAERARLDGRVHTRVCLRDWPDVGHTVDVLAALGDDPSIEVAFVVFPVLDLDRLGFAHFIADVRARDAALRGRGRSVFALADFHPTAAIDVTNAERLVPFLRRTPDPTLQLVRHSALSAVRLSTDQGTRFLDPSQLTEANFMLLSSPAPPLAARVAKNNLRSVERMGTRALADRIDRIAADRDASYFALGVPLPLWKAPT